MEGGGGQGEGPLSCARVSRDARRCRFRRGVPVTPKFVSRSDPAAQWTGAHKGHAFFAYATNYLIDTEQKS